MGDIASNYAMLVESYFIGFHKRYEIKNKFLSQILNSTEIRHLAYLCREYLL